MTTPETLLAILEKLKDVKILAVGDVMLDQFVYGEVARISPEAPVPVLSVKRRAHVPGGVGNVAANLCGLGASVNLVSVAGADVARTTLNRVLADIPNLTPHLLTDPSRPTIQKDRFLAGPQQMLRVDDESTDPISPAFETDLLAACKDAAKGCHAILVSDYGKGIVTDGLLKGLLGLGLPVFIDPKGRDYKRYKGARLVTPNRKELGDATGGMPTSSDADIVAASKHLIDMGIQAVLATRSGDGMTLVDGKTNPTHLRTQAREVFDVSGAGDTVIATACAAFCAGADMVAAAALANIAGGIIVEKVGTAAIRAADLQKFLAEAHNIDLVRGNDSGRTIAPVMDWQEAKEQVERWRARGLKIGFTNGCFDLVHQGHVTMLDKCRRHCDRLVLGLNCDESVARLKGPARPVNRQDARAQVIAALGSVDAVVLFGSDTAEGDTPLTLIKTLRPDMIFKGADYTADTVVGGDFVQSYGGRVVLIDLEEGFSTTNTLKKLGSAA